MPVHVGPYDAGSWPGLVLSDAPGRGFGLRLAVERGGERAESEQLYDLVHEVGPRAPDGAYARISFDTELPFGRGDDTPIHPRADRAAGLTVEWARVDERAVVGRLRADFDGFLEVCGYFPWDWDGAWEPEPGTGRLAARSKDREVAFACRIEASAGAAPEQPAEGRYGGKRSELRLRVAPGAEWLIRCALGASTREAKRRVDGISVSVGELVDAAARRHEAEEARVSGAWSGLARAVTRESRWSLLLQPESGRLYAPAGRRWIFPRAGDGRDDWTVFAWDGFFVALELGLESPELAATVFESTLATQYANGVVPNWRGRFGGTPDRSQPPVGSYCLLKHYLRTGDAALVERCYDRLVRWSAWWSDPKDDGRRRDGDGSGLFQWGSDDDLVSATPPLWERGASGRQRAAWESGQDDLPNWEEARWVERTETLDLYAVDLSSYLTLDYECLGRLAAALGRERDAAEFAKRAASLRERVEERLWDEERGAYVDVGWDGRRSPRLAASNFLPLLAGIPDEARAARAVDVLLDDSRFWGEWVLPSVSRDDPAFADQQYWRGAIWPPMNYLIGQGLRRYGFYREAGRLAARSAELLLRSWRTYQVCRENYDSRTGEGGGHRHQAWGPLLALLGLEEFLDVTPWDGLRIGSLEPPPSSTLCRVRGAGHEWEVGLAPDGVWAAADGRPLFRTTAPAVLRELWLDGSRGEPPRLAGELVCDRPVEIALGARGAKRIRAEGGRLRFRATLPESDREAVKRSVRRADE